MVGGGIKKDDGLAAISSTNIFSALEKKRRKSNKKKLSDKEKGLGKGKDSKGDKEDEPEQFWAPSQVTVKSWADCDDDEDYYATTAPPPAFGAPEDQSPEAASALKDGALSQGEVIQLAYKLTFAMTILLSFHPLLFSWQCVWTSSVCGKSHSLPVH
jgi:hypothetical protein